MVPSPQTGIYEHCFYKRLIVLSSLHSLDRGRYHRIKRLKGRSQPSRNKSSNLSETASVDQDKDIELRTFLDRLAEICASTKGGSTVTAVTVHLPEGRSVCPEYLIISNQRSEQDMKRTKAHIEETLKAFHSGIESNCIPRQRKGVLDTYGGVLKRILLFNRGRLNVYQGAVLDCLQELYKDTDLDDPGTSPFLFEIFRHTSEFADIPHITEVKKLRERSNAIGLLECVERLRSTVNITSIQRPHFKYNQFRRPGAWHRSDKSQKDRRDECEFPSLS